MAFNCYPQNMTLLLELAMWRDEEYKNGSLKKAKMIQKAMRNIMASKDAYRKKKHGGR